MKMVLACVATLALAAVGVAQSSVFGHSCDHHGSGAVVSEPQSGYGACYVGGCYCKAFEGSGNTCSNCGHNYYKH